MQHSSITAHTGARANRLPIVRSAASVAAHTGVRAKRLPIVRSAASVLMQAVATGAAWQDHPAPAAASRTGPHGSSAYHNVPSVLRHMYDAAFSARVARAGVVATSLFLVCTGAVYMPLFRGVPVDNTRMPALWDKSDLLEMLKHAFRAACIFSIAALNPEKECRGATVPVFKAMYFCPTFILGSVYICQRCTPRPASLVKMIGTQTR